jgi:hypothetical protein
MMAWGSLALLVVGGSFLVVKDPRALGVTLPLCFLIAILGYAVACDRYARRERKTHHAAVEAERDALARRFAADVERWLRS